MKKSLNRYLLRIYLWLAVPLLLAAALVNYFGLRMLRGQAEKLNAAGLRSFAEQSGRELRAIEEHLYTFCAGEPDVANMQYLPSETARVMASKRILDRMRNDVLLYPMMRCEFLYSACLDSGIVVRGEGTTFEANQQINAMTASFYQILRTRPQNLCTGRWQPYHQGQDTFLVYVVSEGDAYMGFVIPARELLQVSLPESNVWLARLLIDDALVGQYGNESAIEMEDAARLIYEIGTSGMLLEVSIVQEILQESLRWQIILFTILPLVVLLTVVLLYSFTARKIVWPIRQIVRTMEKAGSGDLEARIDSAGMPRELAVMGETFNGTLTKINALQKKEQKAILEEQKSRLHNLQLQINPHFLGNCFNMLYNASMCGNNELILALTTHLSQYFRRMAQMEKDFIRLEEELDFTDDFLTIQKLRFTNQFDYVIRSPENLMKTPVPPSVIKSLAENAVRYAREAGGKVEIEIEVTLREKNALSQLCVTVSDNGPGFSENVLSMLQREETLYFDGREHIGIANIRKRLKILYGARAKLELSNPPGGGARVTLWIPRGGEREAR